MGVDVFKDIKTINSWSKGRGLKGHTNLSRIIVLLDYFTITVITIVRCLSYIGHKVC